MNFRTQAMLKMDEGRKANAKAAADKANAAKHESAKAQLQAELQQATAANAELRARLDAMGK